jgi:N-acetylglucosaminyldiphosphoundecaprenol N-acetyl-beta-D-mannosaminyltransferase
MTEPVSVETYDSYSYVRPQIDLMAEYANVLGVRVSAVNMDVAVRLTDQWIAAGKPGYVCVSAVHSIMEARYDPSFMRILNDAVLNVPDGMPLTWVGRLQGHREMDRVFGPEFMLEMCRLSVERGYRSFIYGGQPGVAEQLRTVLTTRFPGLQIAGICTPPFRKLNQIEESELVSQVHAAKPDIVWVGLGAPKQERFMAEHFKQLQVPLMIGVGAAFDYHTGRIRDCSNWMKRAGLQWLHRLAQDPRRLWKRYLRTNPSFLLHIACQLSGIRSYRSEGDQSD